MGNIPGNFLAYGTCRDLHLGNISLEISLLDPKVQGSIYFWPFKLNCTTKLLANQLIFYHSYCRYLDRYEKIHFLGEDADRASEDDEESRHKRWSAKALHSVPLTYNHHQHNIAGEFRTFVKVISN